MEAIASSGTPGHITCARAVGSRAAAHRAAFHRARAPNRGGRSWTPASALPALADSDAALQDALAALFGNASLERIFHLQQIAERFAATIDNLPRPSASAQRMPVLPAAGTLATTQDHGQTGLSAGNGARYTPYVEALEAVDNGRLVATYVHFYPLFQRAYEDLGYPDK